MKRSARIKALLSKSHEDSLALAAAYDASRGGQPLSDEIKVLIKNIFENLRSCLDYMAHEIFDKFCTGSRKPDKLYFPIRPSATEFTTAIAKSFPGLESTSKAVRDLLESVQPYRTKWLGQFNKLNNYNKHEDLSDHIQVDGQRITMRSGGGIISIGTAIGIAPDAKFFGVPVDPVTRLPVQIGRASCRERVCT